MNSIVLFPGQGAQYVGMAKDFYNSFSTVKKIFTLASDISSLDCTRLLFDSSEEELKETEKTQVAVTLANLSAFYALTEKGKISNLNAVAGFSLGEYSALHASGVINLEDCFKLVTKRGQLMAKAGSDIIAQKGPVAMAAIMGLEASKIEKVLKGRNDLFVANYNSPLQTIISGMDEAIEQVSGTLKILGAKRVIKLKVSGPFHTPLLLEAQNEFTSFLNSFTFNEPTCKLFSNVSGNTVESGNEAKTLIGKQISSPVKWIDIETKLNAIKTDERVIEVGPGNVLSGLWKALLSENINNTPTIEAIDNLN